MIKKGVILAGGRGSRMMPATTNINKHLLPVYSNFGAVPMIYYPIFTLVKSGLKDILVISSKEHCGKIIENLGDGSEFGANFTYKIQDLSNREPGIASALNLCKSFTDKDSFAVILGDNFFEDNFENEFKNFYGLNKSAIFTKETKNASQFGVYSDGSIEEKPKIPKSNLAVTGLYLYTNHVYEVIKDIKPSNRGELEITDVNNFYCKQKSCSVFKTNGFWSDMGTPESICNTQNFIINNNYKIFTHV
jgi:glucose-1-phosphate thymidylyltransferase